VLSEQCCPNAPVRKILRSIYEGARDLARDIAKILKLGRLRLRGPSGARDEFHLVAIA